MTTVRQLLDEKGHNVITVGSDETVFDATRKMAEKTIGSLVVRRHKSHWHYYGTTLRPERVSGRPRIAEHASGDVMETPVLFARPDLNAEECMAVMIDKRVRHLPVIDEGKLIGIISLGDLVKNIISDHKFTIEQLTH